MNTPQTSIPPILHQLWISPDGRPLPNDVVENISTWKSLEPALEHKLWSIQELKPCLTDVYGLPAWSAITHCRFPAMQSDIVRLAILFIFGGIWSDLKNLLITPFTDTVIKYPLVLVEHPPSKDRPDPTNYLCNAFIGATPRHPFIFDLLEEAVTGVTERRSGGVVGVTGLAMMMRVLARKKTNGITPYHNVMRYDETWGKLMKRTALSYQAPDTHWSQRQKSESLYIDPE